MFRRCGGDLFSRITGKAIFHNNILFALATQQLFGTAVGTGVKGHAVVCHGYLQGTTAITALQFLHRIVVPRA